MAKKKHSSDFEQECRRIATKNIGQIETWLSQLGKKDPEAAIRAWVQISEFGYAKKARDSKPVGSTNINILMQPATKRRLQEPEEPYVDITPKDEKGQNE